MYKCWFNYYTQRIALCIPQKCGISTAKQTKYECNCRRTGYPEPRFKRYQVVRDPVDRFVSFYLNKIVERKVTHMIDQDVLDCTSPEELFEIIQARPHGDTHWCPQWEFPNGEKCTPIPLSALNLLINRHHNRSEAKKPQISQKLTLQLREHYAKDVELYELSLQTPTDNLPRIL